MAEKKWLKDVQAVLDRCPSDRLGFFTIGDPDVTVIDQPETDKYERANNPGGDYCNTVEKAGTCLGRLNFPANVHSTAG
jgi:hypothetical protein